MSEYDRNDFNSVEDFKSKITSGEITPVKESKLYQLGGSMPVESDKAFFIRGYLKAPNSGTYKFFQTCDDKC